ncbi:hypothetical protein BJD99_05775 [Rhodococcus sp. 1163]|nr:hypothetical protein BJD99_05775 [Rhodococcus sp. 1163]
MDQETRYWALSTGLALYRRRVAMQIYHDSLLDHEVSNKSTFGLFKLQIQTGCRRLPDFDVVESAHGRGLQWHRLVRNIRANDLV